MMKQREIIKLVEDYIGTNGGYLNGFSYGIHDTFYHRWCDLDVDVPSYRANGLTTLRAFMQILKDSEARAQAKIIRGVFEMIPPPEEIVDNESRKKLTVHKELLAIAARLEADGQVDTPVIQHTIEVVFEALKDAEALLVSRGPKSAVDRAHTALHGYLRTLCQNRNIAMPTDPSLTAVFKVIREKFPEYSMVSLHDTEGKRVIGSIASALDSLNTIRNRSTMAHPNELLLNEAEAMLYINLARTVMAYIEAKSGHKKP